MQPPGAQFRNESHWNVGAAVGAPLGGSVGGAVGTAVGEAVGRHCPFDSV
jgi:hypothetical protein